MDFAEMDYDDIRNDENIEEQKQSQFSVITDKVQEDTNESKEVQIVSILENS